MDSKSAVGESLDIPSSESGVERGETFILETLGEDINVPIIGDSVELSVRELVHKSCSDVVERQHDDIRPEGGPSESQPPIK